jgi:hypothetical protein
MKLFVTLNVEYDENCPDIQEKICNDLKLKTDTYTVECPGWCDAWEFDTKEDMIKED